MGKSDFEWKTKYEALGSDYEPEKALGSDYEWKNEI